MVQSGSQGIVEQVLQALGRNERRGHTMGAIAQ